METSSKPKITVQVTVDRPVETVWKCWTEPDHIMQWNFAVPEWHCPSASNDLRVSGRFVYHMAARDGSFAFDFSGQYTTVEPNALIVYKMDDDRMAEIHFEAQGGQTIVTETFEAESQNSIELQQGGWQAILDNFKRHAEAS